MSMDNPFRAQGHQVQQSSSRKIWNFFFITALALTVLWLSWALLLDDTTEEYDDSAVTDGGTFLDDDDDTRILSKETRLRKNPADLGEIEDESEPVANTVKSKTPLKQEEEDDEDDEHENIGAEDHHDEDTLTHDDRIHRQVQQRKIEQDAKKKTALADDEDLNLTAEDLKKLAEEDHDDPDDEPAKPTKVDSTRKTEVSKPTQPPRKQDEPMKKKPEVDEEDIEEDQALVGDDDDAEEDADIKPKKPVDSDSDTHAQDFQASKDVKNAKTIEKEEEESEDLPPPMPEDDHEDVVVTDKKKVSQKEQVDDEDEELPSKPSAKQSPADSKKKPAAAVDDESEEDLTVQIGDSDDEEEEEDDVDDEVAPRSKPVSTEKKTSPVVDEGEAFPDVPAKTEKKDSSKDTGKSAKQESKTFEDDEEEEDVPPGPPSDDDDAADAAAEDAYMAAVTGKKNVKTQALDEVEDEDTDGESSRKHLPTKKPVAGKPVVEDVEQDDDDDAIGHSIEMEEEDEEEHVVPASKAAPASKAIPTKALEEDSNDDEQHPAMLEHEEDDEAEDEDDGVALSNKAASAIPEDKPEKGEPSEATSQKIPCDSLRIKSECDSREECKWKYPKSETKGFFCLPRETCEDAVSQKKSHCLSLPKCAWVRVSHSSYGCRATGTPDHQSVATDDKEGKVVSSVETAKSSKAIEPLVFEDREADDDEVEEDSAQKHVDGENCDLHERKAKCIGTEGCSWLRISTTPTKYGCRATASSQNQDEDEESKQEAGVVEELDDKEDENSSNEVSPKLSSFTDKDQAKDIEETTTNEDEEPSQEEVSGEQKDEEVEIATALQGVCSSIRVKSACRFRTDCYWKYPVSYSSGKYCADRQLAVKVAPEKAQLYESFVSGKQLLFDDARLQPIAPPEGSQSRWKSLGSDWKRHRTDVSCALHPECLSRENVTGQYYPGFPGLDIPSNYVRAQCCSIHPPLRSLFLQVVEFLNREGVPWWMSAKDSLPSLFADGFMLPWTSQITIEVAVFGSKSALDYASTTSLRANLTSFTTTRTRVLRSTKNEFAHKLLQFNADPQHLPNTMRVCLAKFVAGSKASSSSYSSDWLRSEVSGDEQCLVSKSSKMTSSKTPTHFVVSHIDEIDDKGPSIKIVPRIFRTASSDACLELWRPGKSSGKFAAVPMNLVFPTNQCFGHGKFQGFTGVARCARDPKAFLAWEMAASGEDRFLSSEAKSNLAELREWVEVDYCHRGIVKVSSG